jgi:hypothetical protein
MILPGTSRKTVVVEMKVEMVIEVQADDTHDDIEFLLNESSHCANNEIEKLYREVTEQQGEYTRPCGCARTEFSYLREATEQDHKRLLFVPESSGGESERPGSHGE